MSFRKKIIHALGWELASVIFTKGMSAILTLVLSNYVSPSEFGQIATVFIFYNILTAVTGLGFEEALTRLKSVEAVDKSTAFIAILVASVCLYLLLYVAAPSISRFFSDHELVDLLRVCCLVIIIEAISTIPKTQLVRSLNFRPFLISSVLSGLISFGMAFIFIYNGFGIWALIIQIIGSAIIKLTILIWITKWKPSINFSAASFDKLFQFSKFIIASKSINAVFENSHFFTISKFISLEAAGYYFFSNRIKRFIFNIPVNALQKVTFPALAQKNDNPDTLKYHYRKIIKSTSLLIFPVIFGIVLFADAIFLYILDSKWQESQEILALLCFSAALLPLHSINVNILHITGRSDINFYLSIFRKFLIATSLFIAYQYGLYAMLYANILFSIITYIPNSYYSKKLINYSRKEQLNDFFPSLITYLAIYLACKYFSAQLINKNSLLSIYTILSYLFITTLATYLLPLPGKRDLHLALKGYLSKQ